MKITIEEWFTLMTIIPKSKSIDKWRTKKIQSERIALKMEAIGERARAERMSECSNLLEVKICEHCGDIKVEKANLCRDRLCPVCGWRLSLKRYSDMLKVFEYLSPQMEGKQVSMLTLTIKNIEVNKLKEALEAMATAWKRMQQRKIVKEEIIGWARSLEITYNSRMRTAHPHYHILLIWKNEVKSYEYQRQMQMIWRKSNRIDYDPIIDIRDAYSKTEVDKVTAAALEAFKYGIKSKQIDEMPLSVFKEWVNAIKGIRMIGYGGIIKEARTSLNMQDDEATAREIEGETIHCPECAGCYAEAIATWSGVLQKWEVEKK